MLSVMHVVLEYLRMEAVTGQLCQLLQSQDLRPPRANEGTSASSVDIRFCMAARSKHAG